MPSPSRSPDEVIERVIQVAAQGVHEHMPDDVHFLLIGYRAKEGSLFMTWIGSGTVEDRKQLIASLHSTFQKRG